MSTNILSLSGVSKSHDGHPLIESVSLGVDAGDKVGIIGPNGAGKSTLLRIIAGTESSDSGKVAIRKGTRLAFLEQIPDLRRHDTVRDALEHALQELRHCIAEYESAAAAMRDDAPDLLERIEQLGGWDYEHRIEAAASQLGLQDLGAPIDQLSGGERKRVALARLVLEEPQLLLLDEPTNHLDAQMVDWLQGWLTRSRATVVIVTHDRYFLDDVVQRMIELRDGSLKTYAGNYTDFLTARAIEEAQRERTRHRQLRALMSELEWAKRSPRARTTKSRARLQRIDQTQEEVERLTGQQFVADFRFGKAPRLGGEILKIDNLHMRYGDGPELIAGLSLQMRRGERIGILGPNGCGKSTLLEMLVGELEPSSGEIVVGLNTRIAYFDQQREALDPNRTVRETLTDGGGDQVYPGGASAGIHVASWLDRFGFKTATHNRQVSTLSGGERNRLAIARFLLNDANLLILDEPTNDLDIPTLNMLEDAIVQFDGCVVVVSHDRYLLDKIATGILAFEQEYLGPGAITFVQGNYTHYHDQRLLGLEAEKLAAAQEQADADRRAKVQERPKDRGKQRLTYHERQELAGLEAAIEQAEAEVAVLTAKLNDPELWSDGAVKGRAMQDALERAQTLASQRYTRWEELLARTEEEPSPS